MSKGDYKRGSEWRKWDLHVHSPKTFLNNGYGSCSDDDFINKVVASELCAIGLTNYFKFEDSFWNLKKKLEKKGIIVFPNLELRLTYTNKENDCCDLHIIFSNLATKDQINTFLGKLNVKIGSDQKTAQHMSNEDFKRGVVEFNDVMKCLNDESVNIDFLIAFLSRGKGNTRSSSMYEHVNNKSHIILHSSTSEENINNDRVFWLENGKPLLQSSDAHNLDTIGTKYTWIKADPTFEGLKQVVYEPEERVCIEHLKPETTKKPSMVIDRIEYSNKNNNGTRIVLFNQNLNSLIGIRGSGKSNLLKNIVYHSDRQEYMARGLFEKDLLQLGGFNVVWRDGKPEGVTRKVLFIPQKYLGSKVYEEGAENAEGINDFVRKLLESNTEFRNAQENINKVKIEQSKKIDGLIVDLLGIQETTNKQKEEIKKYPTEKELKEEIEKKTEILKKEKDAIDISDEELKRYEELIKEKSAIEYKVRQYNKDIESYRLLSESGVLDIKSVLSKYEFSEDESKKIDSYAKKSGDGSKEFIEERKKDIDGLIEKCEQDIKEKDEDINPIKEKLAKREDIKKIDDEIKKDNEKLNRVSLLLKEKDKKEKEEEKIKVDIKEVYTKTIEILVSISNKIEVKLPDTVKIEFKLEFDQQNFNDFLNKLFERDAKHYREEINNRNPTETVIEIFDKLILGEGIKIRKDFALQDCLVILFNFRHDLNYLNNIKNNEGVSLQDMSAGQKMITLLTLIFSFDDNSYPVLIDQPEDDLDSTTIAETVCEFIRKQKKERQIIIASHNANLVIRSDSEEVLIASNGKGNFNYQTGSIENPEINKGIVKVLEGGEEAFKKRRDRYQF